MTRSEEIHSKGFDLFGSKFSLQDLDDPLAYRKIKVGPKTLDDAILNFGDYSSALLSSGVISKGMIYRALASNDFRELRRISNLFYSISGMYQRVCDYFA